MLDDLEARVASLTLDPDDVLVLLVKQRLTTETANRLAAQVKDVIGDRNSVMVLDGDAELAVLKARGYST